MQALWDCLASLPPAITALFGVALATAGWVYSAKRNRTLSKKQHTFNALLQASFAPKYQDAMDALREHLRAGKFPEDLSKTENSDVRKHLKFILNHYEFLAAGIRNGDISERLLRDSEKSTIIVLFESSEKYVHDTRDNRKRTSTYEHIQWLYERWHKTPVWWQCCIECAWGRPLYHDRHRWLVLVGALLILALLVIGFLHLPGEMFHPSSPPVP